jgi:hypothetical protein
MMAETIQMDIGEPTWFCQYTIAFAANAPTQQEKSGNGDAGRRPDGRRIRGLHREQQTDARAKIVQYGQRNGSGQKLAILKESGGGSHA